MAISFDSKLIEILACSEAAAILEEAMPGISADPALKMIYGLPLSTCCLIPQVGFTPEMTAKLKKRINALGK